MNFEKPPTEQNKNKDPQENISVVERRNQEILKKIPKLRKKIKDEGLDWIRDSKQEPTKEEIEGILHGFGPKFLFTKSYFDQIELPESEKELIKDPEALIKLREEFTELLREKFMLYAVGLTPEQRSELTQQKESYKEQLEDCDKDYAEWIRGEENASKFDNLLYPPLASLKLKGNSGFAYRNMELQDSGSFIHWRSPEYIKNRLKGEDAELKHRIYLNPASKDIVKVFKKVLEKAEQENLPIKTKIYNRALELGTDYKQSEKKEDTIRGDGIVIYLKDENDMQVMLDYALELYEEEPEVFAERELSKIPLWVVPGVGIGDEPDVAGKSLTSHRVEFLTDIAAKVKEKAKHGDIDETEEFQKILKEEAPKYNINPNNIAFNLENPDRGI